MCKVWRDLVNDHYIHGNNSTTLTCTRSKCIGCCSGSGCVDRCRTPGSGNIIIGGCCQCWCGCVLAKWSWLRKHWCDLVSDHNIHGNNSTTLSCCWCKCISGGSGGCCINSCRAPGSCNIIVGYNR